MLTIRARRMKKSAFIRSQVEASKIGQKVKKIFLQKPFLPLSLMCCQINPFEPVFKMAGCKRCALKRRKGKEKKKRKGKEEKNGIQNLFFISPRACFLFFFICAVVIFWIYKENYI